MTTSRNSLAIIAAGLVFLLFLLRPGPLDFYYSLRRLTGDGIKGPSGLARYRHLRTLSADEFPLHDPRRRVIIVGDIHGMKSSLDKLLKKIVYDGENDDLVHTGDILTKADHDSSMQVLQFMTTHNITGVRGNHDQMVIEWKGWLDWINGIPEGRKWLSRLHDKWLESRLAPSDLDAWIQEQCDVYSERDAKWWKHLPKKWIPFGDHYKIAKDMTDEQYAYLLSLPLKLYIPSAHTFIVHAGLLPYDLRYSYDDKKHQPLAKAPTIQAYSPSHSKKPNDHMIQKLRRLQEEALLYRVPQNTNPWANLNVRGVLNHQLTKNLKGTPWSHFWNHQMSLCDGFHNNLELTSDTNQQPMSGELQQKKSMPCYPSNVVYGHAASRGLDINRWTIGLDSGCVYGRRLTALILGPNPLPLKTNQGGNLDDYEDDEGEALNFEVLYDEEEEEKHDLGSEAKGVRRVMEELASQTVEFGDEGHALIVSVGCSQP